MKKEEEWSLERIKAEMDNLKWPKYISFFFAIVALFWAILFGLTALSNLLYYFSMDKDFPTTVDYKWEYQVVWETRVVPTFTISIVLFVIGFFLLKIWSGKNRRYNELKARL